jgi:predicted GNAT superfamily acetyltransferase
MARIVHVGGFSLKLKGGALFNGVPWKLSNGFIRNGHSVINFSDRDVARAQGFLGHRKFGIRSANEALRSLCRTVEPDLLVLAHADVIAPATVADIRADLPGLRVVQVNVDPMFEQDNVDRLQRKADVVDATFVTTAGDVLLPLCRPGKAVGFMPNPVDFSIERGRADLLEHPHFDLFFAFFGGHLPRNICGADWTPEDLLALIERSLPKLRVKLAATRNAPMLVGATLDKALASTGSGLNFSRRNDYHLYSSDRISQMVGNGQAVLVDRATGYGALFSDEEFAFFATIDEMLAQIDRLASDDAYRRRIGGQGRARYHALFNEQIVARYIHNVAFGSFRETDYPWPTLVST